MDLYDIESSLVCRVLAAQTRLHSDSLSQKKGGGNNTISRQVPTKEILHTEEQESFIPENTGGKLLFIR